MFFVLVAKLPRLTINIARYPLSSVATRSFIASPRVAYANSKTSPHPTTEQSHSPAPAKRGRKPKEQASKEKPKKIVIPEDMKPPKTPGTPYALYMKDFFEKSPKPSNRDETHALFKQCGVEWKALADAEKERYRETYRRNREEFNEKKEEWFKNTDPEMLKAINAARKKSGKPRLVPNDKPKSSKPLVPFFQFMKQLRAQSTGNDVTSIIEFNRRAGALWRSLPEKEKQQYKDVYEREMSEWRARQAPA